jgi:hypothetical protein
MAILTLWMPLGHHINERHENTVCPNPQCPARKLDYRCGESQEEYLMRALAHIEDEPVLNSPLWLT